MAKNSSYQRVIDALEHREPDRIPFDLGAAAVTGINIRALRNLKNYLGIKTDSFVKDEITQLADFDPFMAGLFKTDVGTVTPQAPSIAPLRKESVLEGKHYRLIDEFGIGWQMPVEGGLYYDQYHHPLAGAESARDIERYPWPDPLDPERFAGMDAQVGQVIDVDGKACFIERMSSGMWEHAMWMTGYEKFLIDMLTNRVLIEALMEKILELKMKYWGRVLDIIGNRDVVISCADDLGTQESLLVSLDLYKDIIWPYHCRLFRFIKERARGRAYIFFHNDGAIMETIPLLIEAGVDILNPFQVNCRGMDTARFKRDFGKELTIWGGSCDSQFVLPKGTPGEVRDETRRRIEDLAPGGGFIFAPIHVIQGDVPPENIMAWWETLNEYW
ncbi:MAG: uroporphyrinogen decarboxylase family protein [Bacteroidales bacterium]